MTWKPRLHKELVLGYVVRESVCDYDENNEPTKVCETIPITTQNSFVAERHATNLNSDSFRDLHEIKGIIQAPQPTYEVCADVPTSAIDTEYRVLGYEHPNLEPNDWYSEFAEMIQHNITKLTVKSGGVETDTIKVLKSYKSECRKIASDNFSVKLATTELNRIEKEKKDKALIKKYYATLPNFFAKLSNEELKAKEQN